MTLAVASRNDYIGTGLVDTYTYGFKIFAASDLQVTIRDADDVETELSYPSGFDVTGVGASVGGTIVLSDGALDDGFTLTIRRVVELTQETDLRNSQGFFPEVLESQFDRQTMISQQQQDAIDRAAVLPVTVDLTAVSPVLPAPGAGKFIRWNSIGSALEAVTGTPTTMPFAKVKDYGAVGNGIANDTPAFILALAANYLVYVPAGTYRVNTVTLASYRRLVGDGQGATIIKAIDGAVLDKLITIPNTASGVTFVGITFDGNRNNEGMLNGTSALCNVSGRKVKFSDCEMTGGTYYGAFVGDNALAAKDIHFELCDIHDNGGVVSNAGHGIGVGSGGVVTPQDIRLTNCTVRKNYNTITKPNDSSGVNMNVKGVKILGCVFEDNYNEAGGQIVINGDTVSDICDADISDNTIRTSAHFGAPADRTAGIEIQGKKFNISRNKMYLINTDETGISIGTEAAASGGSGMISFNEIEGCGTGIALSPNTPLAGVTVIGNRVDALVGISTDASHSYINIKANDFRACVQAQAGTVSATTYMSDNMPHAVSNSPNGRVHVQAVGVDSASHLTLGNGNANEIAGTTDIDLIDSTGWDEGDIVALYFDGALTVHNGVASVGNFKTIKLDGAADLIVGAFDTLYLQWQGDVWLQVAASNNT